MNRTLILSVCCALALWVPAGVSAQSTAQSALPAQAAEAARVVDAFHAAMSAGDAAAAAALLADDAVVFEVGHVERSKAQFAAEHLPADLAYSKAVKGSPTGRTGQATGDLAWIATEGRSVGRYRDKDVDRVTTETMVLRKTPAGWRITHVHWSSRAPTQ